MKCQKYLPEGSLFGKEENTLSISGIAALKAAQSDGLILEAVVLRCDSEKNLYLALGNGLVGKIPRSEAVMNSESARDIAVISRVGKPTCFKVTAVSQNGEILLSRAAAQREAWSAYLSKLGPGEIIDAAVTHLEPFGAFVDVGCGINSFIALSDISASRIDHPCRRFFVSQKIHCIVCAVDSSRVFLSHRELLGTWEENAEKFSEGETVQGTVRSIKSYGIFIELSPNLAGLAEFRSGISENDCVSVYIRSILPQKMKIKLEIISVLPKEEHFISENDYFVIRSPLRIWQYSPESSLKTISRCFLK